MSRLLRLTAAALIAAATGCASSTSSADPRQGLRTDTDALAAAARQHSLPAATAAAQKVRADLATLTRAGTVTDARARAIDEQIARVLADLAPRPTPVAVAATPSPAGDDQKDEEGKPKGKGKGKDH